MMFINLSGTPGELKAVREIGVVMAEPVGAPSLEIRSVQLSKQDPGDALLEDKPLVDQFGQWMRDDWPGKATSLEQLQAAWAAEEKALGRCISDYCRYGGYREIEGQRPPASSAWRRSKASGGSWIPTATCSSSRAPIPSGHRQRLPRRGAKQLFAALPPADLAQPRGGRGGASFYTWNMVRRFGADWSAKWVDLTARRMSPGASIRWATGATSGWAARTACLMLVDAARLGNRDRADGRARRLCAGVSQQSIDRAAAEQCEPHKDDPYVLGYFLGNEPPWPGRETVAVDAILRGPASALQNAAKAFLAEGDTPERRQGVPLPDAIRNSSTRRPRPSASTIPTT